MEGLHSGNGSLRRVHAPADQTQLRSTQLRVLAEIHPFFSAMASTPTLYLSKHFEINTEQLAHGLHKRKGKKEGPTEI